MPPEPVTFRAVGRPVPQPRPRPAWGRKGYITSVDRRGSDRIVTWKARIVAAMTEARIGQTPRFPDQAVNLTTIFHFLRPKSKPGSLRPWPSVKPDADNLVKAIKDACNGWLWTDDCQVVRCLIEKRYSNWEGVEVRCEAMPS